MTEKPSHKYTVEDALRLTITNLRKTHPNKDVADLLDEYERNLNKGQIITGPKMMKPGFYED